MPSVTIGRLARESGLSRSALLYYDRIGLLQPSVRSPAGYRQYDEEDRERLRAILAYREAGLSLDEIRQFLDAEQQPSLAVLEKRLRHVNERIVGLRRQQHAIAGMMRLVADVSPRTVISHGDWENMLRAAGMDDERIAAWHEEFERHSAEAHGYFLVSLGLPEDEVRDIRERARRSPAADGERPPPS
jgi:MerR family transcriptional regulator, thiopeptide resistance regulator